MSQLRARGTRRSIGFGVIGTLGIAAAGAGVLTDSSAGRVWLGLTAALVGIAGLATTQRLVARNHRRSVSGLRERLDLLDEDRSLHAALLSSLSVGVAAFRGGALVYCNDEARRQLGTRVESVDALPPGLREAADQAQREGGEHVVQFEVDYPARTIEAIAQAEATEGVVVLRTLDVTERVRTDAIRTDFVAAASHELKTPVAAIQAAAETVLTALDDDPGAARAFAERVSENASRLAALVADLLDLSRLEAGPITRDMVDLVAVVEEEIGSFAAEDVTFEPAVRFVPIRGDGADLALAVRNLLDNAVRHTRPAGSIRVAVWAAGGWAVIQVEDDGSGIPQQDLPRIFERFYRVDAARSRATGGTGLGLAIVKHVAEQHGGQVEAESVLGEGSTFRVTFPIAAS